MNFLKTPKKSKDRIGTQGENILNIYETQSFFFFGHYMQHVGSQFPNQKLNPRSLYWKHTVITTGPAGKSQDPEFMNIQNGL